MTWFWDRAPSAALFGAECRFTNTSPTRILTAFENLIIGAKLSEYHTGFRPDFAAT